MDHLIVNADTRRGGEPAVAEERVMRAMRKDTGLDLRVDMARRHPFPHQRAAERPRRCGDAPRVPDVYKRQPLQSARIRLQTAMPSLASRAMRAIGNEAAREQSSRARL